MTDEPEFRPATIPQENIGMLRVTYHEGGVRQFGLPTPENVRRFFVGARDRDVLCRYLITHPDEVSNFVRDRRYKELADMVDFINDGIDAAYAMSDPYHFRQLCNGVTEFYLRGWGSLNAAKLREAQEHEDAREKGRA
jgi:hypothetical protein